jgi:ferredoxin
MARDLYVDKENCDGCASCNDLADVFKMDENNRAEVFNAAGASEEEIQEEIDACPNGGIHWKD